MNSAVSSPYLVREILECGRLQNTAGEKAHGIVLAACARVSRVWHNEACSILWVRQPGFHNVLRLLEYGFPGDAMERCLAFAGLPNVTRLLHYSQWIRVITCDDDFFHGSEDLADACILAGGGYLFPSLKTLIMMAMQAAPFRKSTLTATISLLSPCLEGVHLGPESAEMTTLILANISVRPCSLARIFIDSIATLDDERVVFCKFVKSSPKMETVDIQTSWLDYDVMEALGQLLHLRSLQILDTRDAPVPTEPINIRETLERFSEKSHIWFLSLSSLYLTCYSFIGNTLLKKVFAHARLDTVAANFKLTSNDVAAIGRSGKPFDGFCKIAHSLVHVEVFLTGELFAEFPRLDKRALQCFSSCHALEILTVKHPRVPKLDDADVLSLARYWPALQEISICGTKLYQRQDTPHTTFAILDELPKICPKLTYVAMAFAGTIPSLPAVHNRPAVAYECINLTDTFIFDPAGPDRQESIRRIAAYLSAVLPSICGIEYKKEHAFLKPGVLHPGISDEEWDALISVRIHSTTELDGYLRFTTMVQWFGSPPPFA